MLLQLQKSPLRLSGSEELAKQIKAVLQLNQDTRLIDVQWIALNKQMI